jgi:hypothetical protein
MKKAAVILAAILALAITNNVFAQDNTTSSHTVTISIPEVALLDLENSSTITLAPTAPTEAGEAFSFTSSTNNSIWVNYSSIVATGKLRKVTAKISSGTVPDGLLLKVAAGTYTGTGKGNLGEAAAQVTLDGTDKDLITGIGSCYTESGVSKGHQLTYSLSLNSVNDYDKLVKADTDLTITYTISDDIY